MMSTFAANLFARLHQWMLDLISISGWIQLIQIRGILAASNVSAKQPPNDQPARHLLCTRSNARSSLTITRYKYLVVWSLSLFRHMRNGTQHAMPDT